MTYKDYSASAVNLCNPPELKLSLDALVKAGQIEPEVARQCGEVKETFTYIVNTK